MACLRHDHAHSSTVHAHATSIAIAIAIATPIPIPMPTSVARCTRRNHADHRGRQAALLFSSSFSSLLRLCAKARPFAFAFLRKSVLFCAEARSADSAEARSADSAEARSGDSAGLPQPRLQPGDETFHGQAHHVGIRSTNGGHHSSGQRAVLVDIIPSCLV